MGLLAKADRFVADDLEGRERGVVGGGLEEVEREKSSDPPLRDLSGLPKFSFEIILCSRPAPLGFVSTEIVLGL